MSDADKLSIIGPAPKTDDQVREESKRVIIAYLESVAAMEARIAELEAGLREATEWNWLDDDMPLSVVVRIAELIPDLLPVPPEQEDA